SKHNPVRVGRRQFLKASSAALAVVAAVRPKLFAATAAAPKRLAVGYARLDDAAALVEASSLDAGDGAFISKGARVSLSGMSGAPADPSAQRAVELQVHFSYFDGAVRRDAPYYAWSSCRKTGNQGNPVTFFVPVDELQKIRLSVGTETARR